MWGGLGHELLVATGVRDLERQIADDGPQRLLRAGARLPAGAGRRRYEGRDHRPRRDQDDRWRGHARGRGERVEEGRIVGGGAELLRELRANEGRLLSRRGRRLL